MKRYWLIGVLLLLPLLAAAQKIDSKKCYELVTPDGWVLDVQGAVQTDTPILLSKREAGNAGQVWQLRPLGKNVYQLVNGLSALSYKDEGNNVGVVVLVDTNCNMILFSFGPIDSEAAEAAYSVICSSLMPLE